MTIQKSWRWPAGAAVLPRIEQRFAARFFVCHYLNSHPMVFRQSTPRMAPFYHQHVHIQPGEFLYDVFSSMVENSPVIWIRFLGPLKGYCQELVYAVGNVPSPDIPSPNVTVCAEYTYRLITQKV